MPSNRSSLITWGLLLFLAAIWGSSFILMKRGLFHAGVPVLTPWQVATTRLSIAWLTLAPVLFRHAGHMRHHWRPLLGTGMLGNGIPAVLFAVAQSRIDSSLSGVLNGLTPLMTLLAGVFLFQTPVRMFHVVGILLGLAGAVGLVAADGLRGGTGWTLFALLPVVGAMCYGLSGNIVKRHLYSLPPMAISALALTWVGPLSIGLALTSGLPGVLASDPNGWSAFGHVAVLAILSSALALVLWNVLLQRTTALRASTVTYLMPMVAIGWGMSDGEQLSWIQGGMIGVVLLGVYLVGLAERKT